MRIIIVGGGKVIYFLAKTFLSKGYKVSIINRIKEDCRELARQLKAMVICGDGSNPRHLEEAGALKANAVIAITPNDPDNLIICQLAERRFSVPRTVALVNDPMNIKVFKKLGITTVLSTTSIISSLIEQRVGTEEIINLIPIEEGKVNITQVILDESSPVLGSTLGEINLPHDSLLAAIIRDNEVIIPKGDTRLLKGDKVVVITLPQNQAEVLHTLCGPEK